MPSVQNAVANRQQQQDEKQKAVARYIERLGPQIARALPAHLTGDRMTRLALTAIRKTPDLATCSEVSLAGALLTAAALGLEPNTPTGEAYLVPYKGEATLIVGYQGFVKLWWQHPLAASLRAEAVYDGDDFAFSYGSGAFLRHIPKLTGDRGNVAYYYAHATLTTGAEAFVVLTPDEVKALRGKVGPNGGIADPQHWMERKTCIRQLIKMLPKSPNLARAAQSDEQGGTELYRTAAAERLKPPQAIEGQVQEIVDGEPVDVSTGEVITPDTGSGGAGDPQPAAGAGTPKATEAQLRKIVLILADHGIESDDGQRQALSERVGRPLASRKDLTRAEASAVLDVLEKLPQPPAGGGDQ